MAKSTRHTCFISAPFGVDTSVLRRELKAQKVDWLDLTTIPVGETYVDAIRDAIERTDFLCAVVPASASSRWTLLEAGIAIGAGKPLLFIVDREAELPSNLSGYHYALAGATDEEAIRFHLDKFLRTLEKKSTHLKPTTNRRSTKKKRHAPPHFHSEAESEVAQLFNNAGFLLHEAEKKTPQGFMVDLAVWIDELLPIFSSPILPVEIKSQMDKRDRNESTNRLRRILLDIGAGAGLLVELGEQGGEAGKSWQTVGPPPFVFAVSLSELRRVLRSGKLVQKLIQARNRAVHGA